MTCGLHPDRPGVLYARGYRCLPCRRTEGLIEPDHAPGGYGSALLRTQQSSGIARWAGLRR